MTPDETMTRLCETFAAFTSDEYIEIAGVPDERHQANGANSAIGAAFARWHRAGRIEPTGRVRQSRQPSRKGGMIREWRPVTPPPGLF